MPPPGSSPLVSIESPIAVESAPLTTRASSSPAGASRGAISAETSSDDAVPVTVPYELGTVTVTGSLQPENAPVMSNAPMATVVDVPSEASGQLPPHGPRPTQRGSSYRAIASDTLPRSPAVSRSPAPARLTTTIEPKAATSSNLAKYESPQASPNCADVSTSPRLGTTGALTCGPAPVENVSVRGSCWSGHSNVYALLGAR
jgi:hypothetical protein